MLVNVASLAAYQPGPRTAVCSATKSFVLSFTDALWQESHGTGLPVLTLSPGLTRTEFLRRRRHRRDGRNATYQTPGEGADFGLRALDRRNPPPSVVSGRRNEVLASAHRTSDGRDGVIDTVYPLW
jgi:short-subunit dehydrogenase